MVAPFSGHVGGCCKLWLGASSCWWQQHGFCISTLCCNSRAKSCVWIDSDETTNCLGRTIRKEATTDASSKVKLYSMAHYRYNPRNAEIFSLPSPTVSTIMFFLDLLCPTFPRTKLWIMLNILYCNSIQLSFSDLGHTGTDPYCRR